MAYLFKYIIPTYVVVKYNVLCCFVKTLFSYFIFQRFLKVFTYNVFDGYKHISVRYPLCSYSV